MATDTLLHCLNIHNCVKQKLYYLKFTDRENEGELWSSYEFFPGSYTGPSTANCEQLT